MSSNCSVQSLNLYEIKNILFSSQWIKREEKRQLGNALNMNAVYYFFSEDAKYSLQLKIWVESMSLQDAFKVSQTFTLSSQDLKKSWAVEHRSWLYERVAVGQMIDHGCIENTLPRVRNENLFEEMDMLFITQALKYVPVPKHHLQIHCIP